MSLPAPAVPQRRLRRRARRRTVAVAGAAALVAGLAVPLAALPASAATDDLVGAELYRNPWSTTLEAAQTLAGPARADAQLLGSIPSAEWFTSGTPAEVEADVDAVVTAAAAKGQMPVLVAYNLPFRDCAQYSAGGALDTAAYQAWIDGFAAGIGDRAATVILEPDGLGIIPHYTSPLDGVSDWCQPAELDAQTAADDRFAQLNYAVDALADAEVYLDATHSGWLNVGEAAYRLQTAGVDRAAGFFLNASNYNFTENLTAYGRWISSCLAYVTEVAPGDFGSCGNQYWNGGPATDWQGTAMSNFGRWSAGAADLSLNTSGVDSRYASILGEVVPTTGFVIDTSRNGQGPWQAPEGEYSDAEDWCNPPDRGVGQTPTTDTGVDLVDAYLWIKVPGESDGKCFRGTAGPLDPERGIEAPAAGQWFAVQARELIANAVPALQPLTCEVSWTVHGSWPGGFNTQIWVRNTGTTPLTQWSLEWTFAGDQRISNLWSGDERADGAHVTVDSLSWNGRLAPGARTTLGFIGKGAPDEPLLFHLNGRACTTG